MNMDFINDIIEKNVKIYLNNILIELETSHDKWFDDFGFPIFGVTSRYYHEQVYFQSYLESYTRKMINAILKDIIEEVSFDEFSWPEFEYTGLYNGYTNKEYEETFVFEFINKSLGIGYRYTPVDFEKIDEIISDEKVLSIQIIDWNNKNMNSFCYEDSRVGSIGLLDFIHDLFKEYDEAEIDSVYSLLVEKITMSVEKANSMISLVTVPGFTSTYIFNNRGNIRNQLINEIKNLSEFKVKNKQYKSTEKSSIELLSKYKLHKIFLDKEMEKAFIGKSDFAKSFMTSEYMYQYFKSNPLFDYTPIVSGYIKSVEQILHFICVGYRNSIKEYLNMHSFTMGKYTRYMEGNPKCFNESVRPVSSYIIACLDSYRVECRNHLFHKDYFDAWERVEMIRTNTIFLYVALLASINPILVRENYNELGIIDDTYEMIFKKVDKMNTETYYIRFINNEFKGLHKRIRNKGIEFDKYGYIKNDLVFYYIDNDYEKEVVVSRNKIPDEMWIEDSKGNKIRKII